MKYDTLKALVNAKVYENTEQRITGGDMNAVLQSAIASLGAHYQMGGLVSPTDHITVGDEPVVFLATTPGTYTYFGGIVVADGEVALLVWSGTAWSKQIPDIATRTEVSQLGQKHNYYVCSTAASTMNKSVTLENSSSFVLEKGIFIQVKMTYATTNASPNNFRMGTYDNKPLYYNGRPAKSTNTWRDGEVLFIYYDGEAYYAISAEYAETDMLENGSIKLYQGFTTSSGGISSNTARVTTGPIRTFGKKIYVSGPSNCHIQIVYGNAYNALSSSISPASPYGAPYVFAESAQYIAVTFVFAYDTTPDEVDYVISRDDSAIANADKEIRQLSDRDDVEELKSGGVPSTFTFMQGQRNPTTGVLSASDTSISSKIFRVNGTYSISINDGYIFFLRYKADGQTTFVEKVTRSTYYKFSGVGYASLMIRKTTETDTISPSDNTGIKFIEDSDINATPSMPFKWTMVGGNGVLRYCSRYILKAGVTYEFAFSSDQYIVQEGETERFSIYGLSIDGGIPTRTNIIVSSSPTVPDSVYARKYDKDIVLYGVCKLAPGSYVEVTITPRDLSLFKDIELNAERLDFEKRSKQDELCGMFTTGSVVSDIKYKTAITDGFDIMEDSGEVCIGYCGTDSFSETSQNPQWNAELATCNLADVEGTKKRKRIFTYGETYGTMLAANSQHVIAAFTGDDEITVIAEVGGGIYARKYTPSTDTLSDAVNCDIDVLGTVYPMLNGSLYQSNFEAIWLATGMEHPEGRNGVQYNFFVAGRPIRIGNYFYASFVCGNYSHPLLKSQDLIHWTYVCDIPHSDGQDSTGVYSPSEEVSICYYRNRIYASTRGNTINNVNCWNTLLYCDFDDLEDRNPSDWSTPIVLEGYGHERTSVIGLNGFIMVVMGVYPQSGGAAEGSSLARQRKAIMVFDTNFNLLRSTLIEPITPFLHPLLYNLGGIIISVNSTDLRMFTATNGGDGRAEIMINRINPDLLYVVCSRVSE